MFGKKNENSEKLLVVGLISAKNLAKRDKATFNDPYCTVKVGSVIERSIVLRQTVNPIWNCSILFKMPTIGEKDKSEIEIIVKGFDRFGSDSYMGQVNIPLQEILKEENHRLQWKQLVDQQKNDETPVSGEIQIQFEFQ